MYDYAVYTLLVIMKYQVAIETLLTLAVCGSISHLIWIFRTHSFLSYDEAERKVYLDLEYVKAKVSRVRQLLLLNILEHYFAWEEWNDNLYMRG